MPLQRILANPVWIAQTRVNSRCERESRLDSTIQYQMAGQILYAVNICVAHYTRLYSRCH